MAARPFRDQVDAGILDRAAGLFAARGYAKTSVQDVAAAVGLSKAGLLHHFPSKDALHRAVLAQATGLGQRVLDQVAGLPVGPARDRRALEVLVDIALAHPGLVALLLSPVLSQEAGTAEIDGAGAAALRAFGVDPAAPVCERSVRVVAALGGLAVLSLAAGQQDQAAEWRPWVLAACLDALGPRPGAPTSGSDQVEA